MTNYTGTTGNDDLSGSTGNDHFDLTQGGHDTADGLGGNDVFDMGAAFDARDRIYGGDGTDILVLNGNYETTINFGKAIRGIEEVDLLGDFDHHVAFANANIRAGQSLTVIVDGNDVNSTVVDASAVTRGSLIAHGHDGFDEFIGGGGDDVLDGSGGSDILIAGAGVDTLYGGDGGDNFEFGNNLGAQDYIDGGAGDDTITIEGSYTHFVVAAGQWVNVERLFLGGTNTEDLNFDFRQSGLSNFTVEAHFAHTLTFTAKNADSAGFVVHGGQGDDDIIGSNGGDALAGNHGADRLEGGAGSDIYQYFTADDSSSTHYDTIVRFDTGSDYIDAELASGMPSFDGTVSKGALNLATFDADIEAALGRHQMLAGGAALFHPKGGDLKGEWFLAIDDNGHAGYQAGEDVLIHFANPQDMASFSGFNFLFVVT